MRMTKLKKNTLLLRDIISYTSSNVQGSAKFQSELIWSVSSERETDLKAWNNKGKFRMLKIENVNGERRPDF